MGRSRFVRSRNVRCSLSQWVTVCCSLLQTVAVCGIWFVCDMYAPKTEGSFPKRSLTVACIAVCCSVLQHVAVCCSVLQCVAVWRSVVQCVAACYSVLQCGAVCRSVLQCVAVWCSVLQSVAVCCSVWHMGWDVYASPCACFRNVGMLF